MLALSRTLGKQAPRTALRAKPPARVVFRRASAPQGTQEPEWLRRNIRGVIPIMTPEQWRTYVIPSDFDFFICQEASGQPEEYPLALIKLDNGRLYLAKVGPRSPDWGSFAVGLGAGLAAACVPI